MRGFFYNLSRRRPILWALTMVVTSMAAITTLWAIPAGPKANDRQVTRVVSSLMLAQHLSKHPIDDEISQRGLNLYLKSLDPMKVYFTQADINEFQKKQSDLDDMLKAGDISFAYTIFNRLIQRIDERVAMANAMIDQKHDFTTDEELNTDPDGVEYAKDDAEMKDRWRKRIKYDLLVLKADKVDEKTAAERLHRRYNSFAKRMQQTDSDEILEMYVTAMTSAFDPHSTYMSPSSLENFRIMMGLELEGIGAALQMTDGYTVITKIIPGGACEKNKEVKVEDRVISVGQGEDGEMVDVVDMKLNDVVKMIRGKAGTTVRLGIIPNGGTESKIVKITRAKIELADSAARGEVIEDGEKADGSKYKIGYIDLPSFYMDMEGAREGKEDFKSTTRDVRKLLDGFREKGVDAVVLDLRRNGGGSLSESISLTGLFIDQGPVVQVKDPDGAVQHLDDMERGVAWDGPLVILTSKFSASASEILAGALQDYNRALIVGDESTHGKGTVQSLLDLGQQLFRIGNPPNLGALKITMQQFYRPNGDSTQKRGVLADVILPSLTDHMDVSEADLDYAMAFDQVPAARFKRVDYLNKDVVEELKANSAARRAKSEDFSKLLKNIDRYVEQKAKKKITLNEEKYFAQRSELDAEKEEEKQFEEQNNGSGEIVKKDYYFKEILAITLDYAKQLKDRKLAAK